MSVLMGEEVLDALRVWERRERRTESRFESLFCMAVFISFLIFRSMGGVVDVPVA